MGREGLLTPSSLWNHVKTAPLYTAPPSEGLGAALSPSSGQASKSKWEVPLHPERQSHCDAPGGLEKQLNPLVGGC